MDFGFTEEQQLFQRTMRQFAQNELLPKYQERDRTAVFARDVLRRMGDLGLPGLRIPVAYGGADTDYVTVGIACEEVGRGDFICRNFLTATVIAGEVISQFGAEAVKQEWVPPIAAGECAPAIALSEPHCGSDAAGPKTRAAREDPKST